LSHIYTETYSQMPSFLASAVGLRTVTKQLPQSMGIQDGSKKIVPAGTVFPANDNTAIGILYEPVDVTAGDHEGPVIVGGHVLGNRLPVTPVAAAVTAMAANGYGGVGIETATGMVR
jgi:hypothetical protein